VRFAASAVIIAAVMVATGAQAGDVSIARSVPYGAEAEVAEKVRTECVGLQGQLADFTREFAAAKGVQVSLHDEVSAQTPGRVLLMQIDDAVSMGNAFIGHQKYTRISGELYQDGERVAGFRARRNSMGGAFAGYKGSCSVLGRTVRALGRDVGDWLAAPVDGARLGDM
jgi:hypothetical protein